MASPGGSCELGRMISARHSLCTGGGSNGMAQRIKCNTCGAFWVAKNQC